jgi:N-hydroxyarylamine O-acetyltransferase
MNNEGLKLDIPSLYDKIVKRGRGGYCFEQNALFAALLVGMGYNVRCGAARVVMGGLEVSHDSD